MLPDDVVIAPPMAATLWEMSQDEAADLLEFLRNDSLLLSSAAVLISERSWPSYRYTTFCTIWRDDCLWSLPPVGLGLTLSQAHTVLLLRYQAKTQNGQWHTLLDDGYVHAHLTWHMVQASRSQEIHNLLREETVAGRNGWYRVRVQAFEVAGYLDDVRRAWHTAEESFDPIDEERGGPSVGYQCRYALITASVNSVAWQIPSKLLTALSERPRVLYNSKLAAYA